MSRLVYTLVPMGSLPPALSAIFTYTQARAAGLSKHVLYRLRDEGRIEALSRGLYRRMDREAADLELLEIAQRAHEATLCLTTALARHGLTDEIPQALDVALPRGTGTPASAAPAQWHHFDRATFEIGRELLPLEGHSAIGLYSPERSIIDAFRTRGQGGPELAHESFKRWLRRRGSSPAKLLQLANHFPRALPAIRQALELLL